MKPYREIAPPDFDVLLKNLLFEINKIILFWRLEEIDMEQLLESEPKLEKLEDSIKILEQFKNNKLPF